MDPKTQKQAIDAIDTLKYSAGWLDNNSFFIRRKIGTRGISDWKFYRKEKNLWSC